MQINNPAPRFDPSDSTLMAPTTNGDDLSAVSRGAIKHEERFDSQIFRSWTYRAGYTNVGRLWEMS